MQSKSKTVTEYIDSLSPERRQIINSIRKVILKNLPKGFQEEMNYGMIGYVVPHKIYPEGYHCDPTLPLPFLGLASQKNFIAIYHMGIYAQPKLLEWFQDEWRVHSTKKLDMGKSCIRIKKPEDVPLDLIGELVTKMTPQQWIGIYEKAFKNKK
ncbi:MAG: DUF1801 domain-containing protein [Cytophagales bacterium]|jgi:uncharacterized protein YdhG (YjbR/CyaY superfamily)|nr:DUF1801 domain-containing protein [Cytophagales bacterium]MCA6387646.1 DUF1801 domain-containing protein [Cytophagales bacterium]MCA6392109.1 DUF1801 domain-containing protein [Cytophagales bacterium]MCA6393808.1 DUF1801 domain-containing protein [Cytophagales bacterium]MCA6399670.1 DUF1801 domain-containing protein [Cytophagales bacterium]